MSELVHDIGITIAGFVALAIFFCIFNMFHPDEDPSSPPINGPTGGPNPVIVTVVHQSNGLDNDATSSSPHNPHQFAYSEVGARGIKGSYASACSICLADYGEADLIRLLPSCGHLFHLKCIDPWLILHPTCPVCRSSPSPQI
ncbi:PREDICTED: putative RING-H2 finger protein ATL71 [Erythranthe guttata]|uniref:putative RING-H2 finger protein ATL71 n=1 Tax=Erythranthe guttata TaxID=4155 RepID=UPI00064DCC8A|nr:PREDICTED: putative RING-H2 finger protein ATL71 [Erythranthe guttata]|eukprot:XP_012858089.1 PREDICTED: putative RING-H2 finger protein ATL71 [Erythranthe guttata]